MPNSVNSLWAMRSCSRASSRRRSRGAIRRKEVGAGELHADAGPLERLDRPAIERLGHFPVGQLGSGEA